MMALTVNVTPLASGIGASPGPSPHKHGGCRLRLQQHAFQMKTAFEKFPCANSHVARLVKLGPDRLVARAAVCKDGLDG